MLNLIKIEYLRLCLVEKSIQTMYSWFPNYGYHQNGFVATHAFDIPSNFDVILIGRMYERSEHENRAGVPARF